MVLSRNILTFTFSHFADAFIQSDLQLGIDLQYSEEYNSSKYIICDPQKKGIHADLKRVNDFWASYPFNCGVCFQIILQYTVFKSNVPQY